MTEAAHTEPGSVHAEPAVQALHQAAAHADIAAEMAEAAAQDCARPDCRSPRPHRQPDLTDAHRTA